MLRVFDLQRLLDAWLGPLRDAGAAAKVVDEMGRLSSCLDPFRESTLKDFADFLVKAEQSVRTGVWPAPGKAPRATKAVKPSATELINKSSDIYRRAGADGALSFEEIDQHMAALKSLTVAQLKQAAAQVDVVVSAKAKKDSILGDIAQSIKNRKANVGRTSYGSEGTHSS